MKNAALYRNTITRPLAWRPSNVLRGQISTAGSIANAEREAQALASEEIARESHLS